MRLLVKFVAIYLVVSSTSLAFGSSSAHSECSVVLQVNKSQLSFNDETIKHAFIVKSKNDNSDKKYGVFMVFTPDGYAKLDNLSKNNLNERASVIVDGQIIYTAVIQTKMGPDLRVDTLTKEQSLKMLRCIDAHK